MMDITFSLMYMYTTASATTQRKSFILNEVVNVIIFLMKDLIFIPARRQRIVKLMTHRKDVTNVE